MASLKPRASLMRSDSSSFSSPLDEIAFHLIDEPEVGQALRHDLLVSDLAADPERLFGVRLGQRRMLGGEAQPVGEREIHQGLGLGEAVALLSGHREHPVELGDGVRRPAHEPPDLPAPLIDVHDPPRRQRWRDARGDLEGLGVRIERRLVRECVLGAIPRADQVLEGLGPVLAVDEVMSQLLIVVGQPVRVQLLDGAADRPVQLPPALFQEAVVGHVLDHRVLEDVGGLGQEPLLVDDLQRLQLLEESLELPGQPGDALQQSLQELAADDRRELDGALAVLPEPVEARHDDALDGVGHAHLAHPLDHPEAAVLAPEDAEIEERLRHLLDEERHALGLVQEGGLQLRRELVRAQHQAGHVQGLGRRERLQSERRVEAAAPEGRAVADPVGEDDHDRRARHRAHERVEILLRAGVDPVQVLEHEDDGPNGRSPQRHRAHGVQHPLPPGGRVHPGDSRIARVHGQQVPHVRDIRLELPHAPHAVLDLGDDLGLAVELLDAEVLPELVEQRQERDRLAEGDALALQPRDGLARLGEPPAELEQQP